MTSPQSEQKVLGPFYKGSSRFRPAQRVRYPRPWELGGADDLFFMNCYMISFVFATFTITVLGEGDWVGAPREEVVLFLGLIVAILKQAGTAGRGSKVLKTSPAIQSHSHVP